ncbi:S26 family signal peptidase [Leifsonia xyli subsp. xyli]|uniref:Signal peptidase I n=2 Tax=Leifsonia xyli subsp. xyli TaxID=59736 RepID=Q6ADJ5_LEIXX|nr:signal peptidase I [Leifsonia xyli]AAT89551.1 signal peptidase I [Leifsonia xyli subsp. xyli str. CTCB07]ODA91332.1 S26 family signal peptidase [Leifsonia xyli subsp. xyli]
MTETAENPNPRRAARRSGWKTLLRDVVVIFVVAVLVSFLIKTFVARSFYIPSGSMENTLQINDRIIVNELQPSVFGLQRGDVIVFKDPGGWLPAAAPQPQQNLLQQGVGGILDFVGLGASDSDQHLVKRIIGLPFDNITCCNALGQMSVNGVPLREPYVLLPAGQLAVSAKPFDVTVPKGEVWVMGDNRYNSADSRYHMNDPGKGFVPLSDVVGRAFVVSWPVSHWTGLSNYPETFRGTERQDKGEHRDK